MCARDLFLSVPLFHSLHTLDSRLQTTGVLTISRHALWDHDTCHHPKCESACEVSELSRFRTKGTPRNDPFLTHTIEGRGQESLYDMFCFASNHFVGREGDWRREGAFTHCFVSHSLIYMYSALFGLTSLGVNMHT